MSLLKQYQSAPKRFSDAPKMPPAPRRPAAGDLVAEPFGLALSSFVEERWAICEACDGIMPSGGQCALKTCRERCRKIRLARPGMCCPGDPPKWGPVQIKHTKEE